MSLKNLQLVKGFLKNFKMYSPRVKRSANAQKFFNQEFTPPLKNPFLGASDVKYYSRAPDALFQLKSLYSDRLPCFRRRFFSTLPHRLVEIFFLALGHF